MKRNILKAEKPFFAIEKTISSAFYVSVILSACIFLTGCSASESSSADAIRAEIATSQKNLYVIEREIPGAGDLTADQLKEVSKVSVGVLKELGPEIKWMHSYVTGDKIYCVYTAPSEALIREHAVKGGFPANAVSKVATIIDPSLGD